MFEKHDSFSLTLSIEGGPSSPLVYANVVFAPNAKNRATVKLAVGSWENNGSPNSVTINRGDVARIKVSSPGMRGGYTLFTGVVYDFFPSISISGPNGQASLTVTLFGQLYYLTTGTLQGSATVPASYLDSNRYWPSVWTTLMQSRGSGILNEFTSEFGAEFIAALIRIASAQYAPEDSVSEVVNSVFGQTINEKALAVLSKVQVSGVSFRNFKDANLVIPSIINGVNERLMSDWGVNSFFDKIIEAGKDMLFDIVETGSSIFLVPRSPFFQANKAMAILPDSYNEVSAAEDQNQVIRNYKGAVLTPATWNSPSLNANNIPISGIYKPDNVAGDGIVLTRQLPPLFSSMPAPLSLTPNNTAPQAPVDIPRSVGDELAKYLFLYMKYAERKYYVSCPYLRTDIAPLSPVRLQLPRWKEVSSALESSTIYGQVQSVTIEADSTAGRSSTMLEIGYARTRTDQYTIVDPAATQHPLWVSLWEGTNLRV